MVRPGRRPPRATVLATKLYGDMGDWPNEGRLSALNIRRACDASLRRLQTDYIDLYQMHHIDRGTGVGRDLGGDGGAARPGQDPLRRLVELRRLAHRQGAGGGGRAATSWGWSASSPSTTCWRATSSWRCCPPPRTTGWGHSVVAAPGRAARRRGAQGTRREPALRWAGRPEIEALRPQLEAYEDLCARLGEEPGDGGTRLAAGGRR